MRETNSCPIVIIPRTVDPDIDQITLNKFWPPNTSPPLCEEPSASKMITEYVYYISCKF